jgi:adenylate cyclase class IV
MIEVEIRGQLTAEAHQKLKDFLSQNGKHIRSFNREMYMLCDYPGYDRDPINRETDIRLKNTDGVCELVVKKKVSANNVGRTETVLTLQDGTLDKARSILRALGYDKALKMQRSTDLYNYHDVEWSVVRTPKGHYYYEAELQAEEAGAAAAHKALVAEAEKLGLEALGPDKMRDFLYYLDKEENEKVDL